MLNIKLNVEVSEPLYTELYNDLICKRKRTALDLLKHAIHNNRTPSEVKELQTNYSYYTAIIDQLTEAKEGATKKGRGAK